MYIETDKNKILFDLGPNDTFYKNASRLGIDISAVDTVVTSHGHIDHGGGLETFLNHNTTAKIYIKDSAFDSNYFKLLFLKFNVGLPNAQKGKCIAVTEDVKNITKDLILITNNSTSHAKPTNKSLYSKGSLDEFNHEQSLIIREDNKNVLVSGCSHNGILNIKATAENIINSSLDYVIGGFHTFTPPFKNIKDYSILDAISKEISNNKTIYYTCHCTGKKQFEYLKDRNEELVKYISTGDSIVI